jgi:hypothetical protein
MRPPHSAWPPAHGIIIEKEKGLSDEGWAFMPVKEAQNERDVAQFASWIAWQQKKYTM